MCLDKLQKFKVKLDKDGVGEGFKAFGRDPTPGGLRGECCNTQKLRPWNKWLKEKPFRRNRDEGTACAWSDSKDYPIGWHIFKTEHGARRWTGFNSSIRKVKFRNIVVTGIQVECQVIVAKEIFIPK